MKTFLFLIQLFSYLPADFNRAQTAPQTLTPEARGYGFLVVAACQPGQAMRITPGDYLNYARDDGTAMIRVPAQVEGEESYRVNTTRGSKKFNGTVGKDEALSGVCP